MTSGQLTIDGKVVEIDGAKNILELARRAGIELPTFCYHSELSVYGACRLCLVEMENMGLVASCSTPPAEGMVIRTNTKRTRRLRKMILELLLANHDRECTTCNKSGSCKLQKLAKQFGVNKIRFGKRDEEKLPIDDSGASIIKNPNKCILCGDCVRMCKEIQGIGVWDFAFRGKKTRVTTAFGKNLSEVACVNCGQCVAVCPTGALSVKPEIDKAWEAIYDPHKTVVVQIAPAVRVALGEEFGLDAGETATGKMVTAIKKLGVDKVFDTVFAADMTTIEESLEFLSRLENGGKLPLFTSCCPSWVKYCEQFHSDLLGNLSSCRSPQQMFGSLVKKYYAPRNGIKPEDIVSISIMPCTAKKYEARRPEFKTGGIPDVDIVLTTVELAQMIKEAGIVFNEIEPSAFDNPLGMGSGSGLIFGASGGVMESVVRFIAGYTGNDAGRVDFKPVRGIEGIKEAEIEVGGEKLKLAVVNGLGNAEELIQKVKSGEKNYHAVEVMCCPAGCVGGGGQPDTNDTTARIRRIKDIYKLDAVKQVHKAQDNVYVNKVLDKWFGGAGSHQAHSDLHTSYTSRRRINGKPIGIHESQDTKKIDVSVCVGTSCYLKGSYDVLDKFMELTKQLNLEDYIDLKGTFCLENCDSGVSIKVNDEIITGVNEANAEQIFKTHIAMKTDPPWAE